MRRSRAMTARPTLRLPSPGLSATAAVLALAALLACGCGAARQDAGEPKGAFRVGVVHASFPPDQSIARPTTLELAVRNTGVRTAPNVAVTLDSLYYTERFPELASSKRPIWIVDRGPGAIANPPVESQAVSPPGSGQTAYVNTWALGPLAPGETRIFRWLLAPVRAGLHTVHYSVAAGLAGKAKARPSPGAPVRGVFVANIAPAPPGRHVDPNTGKVVGGAYPLNP
jgi:hypothetical protein